MSLFRRAGKKFEEAKRAFSDGAESGYVCRSCGASADEDYEHCPHCGETTVEPAE